MNKTINVPIPCHEDWDKMLPDTQGKHCLSCRKPVIDFTGWDTNEILLYLQNQGNVCGKFRNEQINAPDNETTEALAEKVLRSNISFYKKIAAVIILFFGVSLSACKSTPTLGNASISIGRNQKDSVAQPTTNQSDSIIDRGFVMGKVLSGRATNKTTRKPVPIKRPGKPDSTTLGTPAIIMKDSVAN